ncbi:MAG: hypothetical protein PUP92_31840 [Rhizonema sp. PD38]|nr:hypothetical protein [Rhizonema sp. PD38]
MKKQIILLVLSISTALVIVGNYWEIPVMALPPQEDIPEEILRMELVTEARSPLDGKPLTAAEYIELQAQLRDSPTPKLAPTIREKVYLLHIRSLLRQLFPFIHF